ncbi:ArgS-related anticodon-binding protein NrtL [Streptomyces sp. NRRL S-340]|uniref:ArgS-related anticodon-binding protein NrtL n=1 Tax=Streptomyces sp. NRRL S-340 TaxID=1463901 RepID=UPI0005662250|nr:DALR anticodon-binding domain-containing protein [Streptomyces sp. NRRL S-340]
MTPVELSRTVLCAVRRAVDAGELSVPLPERVVVKPPGPGGCGDYATNVALQLARPAGQSALRVAGVLRDHLMAMTADGVGDVVVTGPGFLNISLRDTDADAASGRLVGEILRSGRRYGYGQDAAGQVVRLHCAAEPRALVVADVLARLLRAQGALVRTTCESPVPAPWEAVLGARADASGTGRLEADVATGTGRLEADVATGTGRLEADVATGTGRPDVGVRPVPVPAADVPALLALGRDAGRWALLHPAGHDRPRTGGDHLVQRESNPLFRVRYAHARTRALHRNAAGLGFTARPGATGTPAARALLAALADHPRVLARAARNRTPDLLARHLVTVAEAVPPLLPDVLPRGEEKPSAAHRARLALAEAAGTVLAGGLSLLGIDAPDHL